MKPLYHEYMDVTGDFIIAAPYHRGTLFNNARLFGGDLLDRVTEIFGVVKRNARDDGGKRGLDDIGGVKSTAHARFKHHDVAVHFFEV